jgi:hypothetical protein
MEAHLVFNLNIFIYANEVPLYLHPGHNAKLVVQSCGFCDGFQLLTAVAMMSSIFWNMTPRSPVKFNRSS